MSLLNLMFLETLEVLIGLSADFSAVWITPRADDVGFAFEKDKTTIRRSNGIVSGICCRLQALNFGRNISKTLWFAGMSVKM